MAAPRIAINGFGRIGRLVTRALLELPEPVDLVGINDLADPAHLAHLFQFDSVHGRFGGTVEEKDGELVFDGDRFQVLAERDPARLPWKELGADYVLECTGHFTAREDLKKHLDAGARRVLLSAPGKDVDVTLVRGVNMDAYDPARHRLVSNASCTTNCLAPVLKVLHNAFGVESGWMTTVHAYTNDQRLLDSQHTDPRRARAAALSMIPTSTGAARAIGQVLPELEGRVDGLAVRVPTPNVSLVDLTVRLGASTDRDEVLAAFRVATSGPMAGILEVEERGLVSADFNHYGHSAIIDAATVMVRGDEAKVLAWYDNEWAYALRLAELVHDLWSREP
jgi:glyceraldehyde 3-phosphate dehydrogenase